MTRKMEVEVCKEGLAPLAAEAAVACYSGNLRPEFGRCCTLAKGNREGRRWIRLKWTFTSSICIKYLWELQSKWCVITILVQESGIWNKIRFKANMVSFIYFTLHTARQTPRSGQMAHRLGGGAAAVAFMVDWTSDSDIYVGAISGHKCYLIWPLAEDYGSCLFVLRNPLA